MRQGTRAWALQPLAKQKIHYGRLRLCFGRAKSWRRLAPMSGGCKGPPSAWKIFQVPLLKCHLRSEQVRCTRKHPLSGSAPSCVCIPTQTPTQDTSPLEAPLELRSWQLRWLVLPCDSFVLLSVRIFRTLCGPTICRSASLAKCRVVVLGGHWGCTYAVRRFYMSSTVRRSSNPTASLTAPLIASFPSADMSSASTTPRSDIGRT